MPHLNRGKLVRVLQEFNLPDAPVVALTGSDAATAVLHVLISLFAS